MSEILRMFSVVEKFGPRQSIFMLNCFNLSKFAVSNSNNSKCSCFSRNFHRSPLSLSKVIKRPHQVQQNREIVARILGVMPEQVKKPPTKLINEELAIAAFKILQDYGFGAGEVLNHPDVFMMAPTAVQNYIEIMDESCFKLIELKMIINFRNVHKQTLKFLQEKNLIPLHLEILQNYCKILEIRNSKTEEALWDSLPDDITRLTLMDLRRQVILQYLNLKLDMSSDQLTKCYEMYPRTSYRCLKWIKECLRLLTDVLKFPKDKIIKHSYLLHGNPFNMSQLIQEIKTLSGAPFEHLTQSRPKILMSACSSLKEIEKLFNDHKIPNASIIKYPEVYTLSPVTVKERLEEMDAIPEFRPLKRHHRVARLLYYQNKAKVRIEHLRSLQMPSASLHMLSADTQRFKKLMSLGEVKTKGSDIANILQIYLGDDVKKMDIRKNLIRQPHWLHCSLVNVEESLQFLDGLKLFSKKQIFSALTILLYPKEKIEKEFENVVASGEAKMTDDFFLHMVLYFLERAVHFSGDGLWKVRPTISQDDDDHEETPADSTHGLENEDAFISEDTGKTDRV